MALIDSAPLLKTIIRMFGIQDIQATTDTPETVIELKFKRRAGLHTERFTVQELINGITGHSTDARTGPPPGYMDIADLP